MGNVRKNLKKRYKRKVTRKRKNSKYYKSGVVNGLVADTWNQREGVAANYAKLGLVVRMNGMGHIRETTDAAKAPEIASVAAARADPLEALRNHRKPKFAMGTDEIRYLQALEAKYSDDYEEMARDIKLNYMQHTANRLERRFELMRNHFIEQEQLAAERKDAKSFDEESDA